MTPSEAQLNRARYVRTVLAWNGVTQRDLAELLGCRQQAVSKKLAGERRFLDDELLLIADTFNLDPGNLLRPPALESVLGVSASAAGPTVDYHHDRIGNCAGQGWSEVVSVGLNMRSSPEWGMDVRAA